MRLLLPNQPAPFFRGSALINGRYNDVSLDDYLGKYLILFFFPRDFATMCPTEIIAFSERVNEFRQIGCEVVACSTDSHWSHEAWIDTTRKKGGVGRLNLPVLSDKTGALSKVYGIYSEQDGVSFRALFIINHLGILKQITINDCQVGRSVDETLRLVQAYQYSDTHDAGCPSGWKPGDTGIKNQFHSISEEQPSDMPPPSINAPHKSSYTPEAEENPQMPSKK